LLEFFQPYPGDERVPWSDDHCEAMRFRILRVGKSCHTIEDTFAEEVVVLPIDYLHQPTFHFLDWYALQRTIALQMEYIPSPIHRFPIEELLADGIQQYFRDIGYTLPIFHGVHIERILREPGNLEGTDDFLVSIPIGNDDLHEHISDC
jgi:hypothetical protein